MKLKQPLKWHGGKSYLANWIMDQFPPHTHYAEPFAGGLAVLLRKECEGISEAVNDLDSELINFWEVLRGRDTFEEFYRMVECVPLGEPIFDSTLHMSSKTPVERALVFFIRARQSRQGLQKDYTTPTRRTRRGMNEQVSAWLTAVNGLPDIHQRLKRVEIRSVDAVEFISRYDHPNCCFYLDPPYVHETRSTTHEYREFEMSVEDHCRLLECLARIEGKFLLSGYRCQLYDDWSARHGFKRHEFEIDNKASSAKRKESKVECAWRNF